MGGFVISIPSLSRHRQPVLPPSRGQSEWRCHTSHADEEGCCSFHRRMPARATVTSGLQRELFAKGSCERVQTAGECEPPPFHGLLCQFFHTLIKDCRVSAAWIEASLQPRLRFVSG